MRQLQHQKRRQSDPATHSRSKRQASAARPEQLHSLPQSTQQQQRGSEQLNAKKEVVESAEEMEAFSTDDEDDNDDNAGEQQLPQRSSTSSVERAPNTSLVVPYCELVALLADLRASVEALDRLVTTLQRFLEQHKLEQSS